MNKKQALDIAKAQLSQVFRVTPGPRGWGYSYWDDKHKEWSMIGGWTYNKAREARADQIATRAYVLLGGDILDAWRCFSEYTSMYAGSSAEKLTQLMINHPIQKQ